MKDPPLAKGDIGGFSKLLNPPLPPFSKGGDANKYMLRVINRIIYIPFLEILGLTLHVGMILFTTTGSRVFQMDLA
jgi:hypothetical protein